MDLQYVAGFVDGEGCVRLTKKHYKATSKCSSRNSTVYYVPQLSVVQKHPEVLLRIGECLDVPFSIWRDRKNRTGCYELRIQGPHAVIALTRLRPHLFVKQKQVDVLLESLNTIPKEREGFFEILRDLKNETPTEIRLGAY